jgi:hypothetical protein
VNLTVKNRNGGSEAHRHGEACECGDWCWPVRPRHGLLNRLRAVQGAEQISSSSAKDGRSKSTLGVVKGGQQKKARASRLQCCIRFPSCAQAVRACVQSGLRVVVCLWYKQSGSETSITAWWRACGKSWRIVRIARGDVLAVLSGHMECIARGGVLTVKSGHEAWMRHKLEKKKEKKSTLSDLNSGLDSSICWFSRRKRKCASSLWIDR